jgi:hypothetical protein
MSNPAPINKRTLPISLARDRLGSSFLTAIFLKFRFVAEAIIETLVALD